MAIAIAATPSLCKLVNRCGNVSSRRCNCERARRANSPPRTRSNAGRRALIRVAHVTRRSKPAPPATSCALRGMSNERMLRTDAEEIGDVELLMTQAKREARRLSPRCWCGCGAASLLRFALFVVFFCFNSMLSPCNSFCLVHTCYPFQT